MKYENIRERIKRMIEVKLFNTLFKLPSYKGLDYNNVISLISKETGAKKESIMEVISIYCENGDLRDERFLFLSDNTRKLLDSKIHSEVQEVVNNDPNKL